MKTIAAALLIIIGSALEIYYYSWRFAQDGAPWWLSTIIGIGLTLFLSVLTLLRRSKVSIIIAVFLIAYSILATTAGQLYSYGLVQSESGTDDYYRQRIDSLNAEYEANQKALNNLDIQTRANWATNGVKPLYARQEEIQGLLAEYEGKLSATRKTVSIYDIVERETGMKAFYVQIILQAALSTFIAMMSPSGIILLTSREKRKRLATGEQIDFWVDVSWSGIVSNKIDYLYGKKSVLGIAERELPVGLDERVYNELMKTAIDKRIVKIDDGRAIPLVRDPERVKKLLRRT